MQFSNTLIALLASAGTVAANTVTFLSQDSVGRTIIFTPNAGYPSLDKIYVDGHSSAVAFQGWNGLTYFDVSAIINANDHVGVKEMWPKSSASPTSGCKTFPCNNAYYLPDDVQTKTTSETDLVCTLGGSGSSKREEGENVKRDYVLGKW
ncbi:unnamed protein product [Parascedosporium putredinis]|uniref:DNase1 protein n=1 Tax=Parascedosporium putredinis TaxID=1442378 RepID=A0A9P1GZM1_9PEZI|nr:unnamed protein product [Parascedosporium putredinis]CAI7993031.1 unnamed protein product [Parascedosporium putredinis]